MTRDEFLARFGAVFENRPDLAAAVWAAGPDLASAESLHACCIATLRALPAAALRGFLDGHPDLAGRLLQQGAVTAESAREQASAGLAALDPESRNRFLALNSAYRARFGFPFIMAVQGRGVAEVLAAFEARLPNDAETEQEEALRQVERILLLRVRHRFPAAQLHAEQ